MKRTLFLLAFLAPFFSRAQTITTYAGNTDLFYGGDGAPATAALMYWPVSVVTDALGNKYVADQANNVVRKIDASGVISLFAGIYTVGPSLGDGGPATAASLFFPSGLAIDAAGNLYIADRHNHRVRRVDASGIITTVAGNGSNGYMGSGVPATATSLNEPGAVAVDAAGNLFIADAQNNMVRKVDVSGIITDVAGLPFSGYGGDGGPATAAVMNRAEGVALDAAGNIYISDLNNSRVRKVNTLGIISTYAGNGVAGSTGDGGAATLATVDQPAGLAVDAAGNLLIADQVGNRVRKVTPGGVISTFAGSTRGFSGDGGAANIAKLRGPQGVGIDAAGNVYIADAINNRVRRVDPSGIITTLAGTGAPDYGDGTPATAAVFHTIGEVATDALGRVYIGDLYHCLVRRINTSGIVTTVAGNGIEGFTGNGGAATNACIGWTTDITLDALGNLYICDARNSVIWKVNTSGTINIIAGNGDPGYSGDGGPATNAELNVPGDINVDKAGNIYFIDQNSLVRKVDAAGIISTVAGSGVHAYAGDGGPATAATFSVPIGVTTDTAGNVFIGDMSDNCVRKIDAATGIITTIAGNGTSGFAGDGGPATAALFSHIFSVATDTFGNIYIGENGNARVRMIDNSGTITTVAGDGNPGFAGDGGPATAANLMGPEGIIPDNRGNLYICAAVLRKVSGLAGTGTPPVLSGYLSKEAGISIYPVPASTTLNISSPVGVNNIVVFDATGDVKLVQKYARRHIVLDIAAWPPGIYYVRINNTYLRKFIKR